MSSQPQRPSQTDDTRAVHEKEEPLPEGAWAGRDGAWDEDGPSRLGRGRQ
jgi:hypothetical protein